MHNVAKQIKYSLYVTLSLLTQLIYHNNLFNQLTDLTTLCTCTSSTICLNTYINSFTLWSNYSLTYENHIFRYCSCLNYVTLSRHV